MALIFRDAQRKVKFKIVREKMSREQTSKQTYEEAKPERIAGYDYGKSNIAASPVSLEKLKRLKETATFNQEDIKYLHLAGDVLEDQTEKIINTWRGVIGSTPHLACYFADSNGKPDENYKARAKERFKQWILDVCRRPYDQEWLNYQHEIGLRHTQLKKNQADQAQAPPQIPLRYLISFTAVVNDTIKSFLTNKGNCTEEVEAMHRAWSKAVILHVTLWSRAYVAENDW